MDNESFGKNRSFEDVSATVLTKVNLKLLTGTFTKMSDPHYHIYVFIK